jgi:hypothetical protein
VKESFETCKIKKTWNIKLKKNIRKERRAGPYEKKRS